MKKHRIPKGILPIVFICIAMIGCDEGNEIVKGPQPDKNALIEFFNSSADARKQAFTVDASTGGSIVGSQGTVLQFSANQFLTESGDGVSGEVDIELIEIYNRSSMLLTKKPTNGKMENGAIGTLVSGGEFYVNAFQDGVQLKLVSGFTIVAPTKNTGDVDQDMRQFGGTVACEGDDCDVTWEEKKDRGIEIGEFQGPGGVQSAYFTFQSQFGWTNIDRWFSDPRPKTTIFIGVPEGFDSTNCTVFIAYDGEPTALGRFDRYDDQKGMFTEHYGLIPIGLKAHIILISIIEDEIHYAIQGATISENHEEVIKGVQSITEEELTNLIDGLP
ncbi:MAG: hypothetical protein OEV74_01070 [Cyclobacteriaceae bacterium]|nr:hypothetical protein [Cyclobacteriaceae bacterium]MDH4294840.1 hypothetical protein [Cyclobacteriaceae bacterium]MDH5248107.1 hypothetical protein [Cyclobacteriaceae bacterium]